VVVRDLSSAIALDQIGVLLTDASASKLKLSAIADAILPLHAKIRLKHSSTTHVELTELFLIFVIFNI